MTVTVTVTITTATATIVVRRNGPGDIGRDDREHSGRAHQVNSRTHTHTTCTHHSSLARSFARLLARGPSARARVSTRRTKKKRKEETPRKRDPRRHQALRASSLSASSCTTRTYPKIPLGETRRKTSGESALSLARIVSLRAALPSARTTHPFAFHPYRSLPLSFASPRQPPGTHSLHPLLHPRSPFHLFPACLSASAAPSPSRDVRSSFSLSPLPFRNPTNPPIENFHPLSLSLSPSPSSPREEICRADSFSSRKSRHLRSRSRAPWQRDSPFPTRAPTTLMGYVPTNVHLSLFVIVLASCSIQYIWISVSRAE